MAIKTIAQLKSDVNTNITQNVGTRGITAPILGGEMIDTIDSLSAVDESLEERKANIDGSYDTMTVGLAKNLEGDIYVEGKTYFKPTATVVDDAGTFTSEEVGSGPATIETISGNTVVLNQKFTPYNSTYTMNGITMTGDGSGKITITVNNPTGYNQISVGINNVVSGHKYYCKGWNYTYDKIEVYNNTFFPDSSTKKPWIMSAVASGLCPMNIYAAKTTPNMVIYPQLFDLTLMFGYGNEPPATDEGIAWFEDWLSKNVGLAPYYAYNAGTLINSKPTGMASIGYNLMELDGTTGTARVPDKYDDGLYGSYYGIRGTYSSVSFVPAATGVSESVTPDGDGKFEITRPGDIVVSGAGSSTTVFMWYDGSYTEEGVEYERNEYSGLDVTKIYGKANGSSAYTQVFPVGLKGVAAANDVLDLNNGTATVNVRDVNLGEITNWYGDTSMGFLRFVSMFTSANIAIGNWYDAKCDKYPTSSTSQDLYQENGTIKLFDTDGICVYDSSITTSDLVNGKISKLNGVHFYYGLANHITYTDLIVSNDGGKTGTPVQVFNYTVDNWGLEELLPQNDYATVNGMATTAPILNVRYSIDAVEAINTINDEVADLYETKADKDGDYPSMTVGTAQNLEGNQVISDPFMFRTSGGEADFSYGLASLQQIDGGSVSFNQNVINGNFTNTDNWERNGGSFSVSNNIITYTTVNDRPVIGIYGTTPYQLKPDNVYYITCDAKYSNSDFTSMTALCVNVNRSLYDSNLSTESNIIYDSDRSTSWHTLKLRIKQGAVMDGSSNIYYGFRFYNAQTQTTPTTVDIRNFMIINLTQMFGAGNEPATASAFEEWLSTHIGLKSYYPYTAGIILNSQLTALDSIGFNQWDEEWEVGSISDSTGDTQGSTGIRSKNFMPCIGGIDYYGIGSPTGLGIYWYDNNKAFICSESILTAKTAPANASYFKIIASSEYGTTYNNDICINLSWDGSRDGEYEPYEKYSLDLPVTTITGINPDTNERETIFPDGFKSAGNVCDSIYVEGGVTKAVKNIESIDLGTLTYQYNNTYGPIFITTLNTVKANGDGVCDKYAVAKTFGILVKNDGYLWISDKSKTINISANNHTSSELSGGHASWLENVILNYELASPIVYTDLQYEDGTPFSLPKSIQVSNWGTEMIQPQNENTLTTCAPTLSLKYAIDAVEAIDTLQNDGIMYYDLKSNMESFLVALNQALSGIGTISISQNPTDKVYTFSFTQATQTT